MAETFVARVSATINASRAKVWDALVDPQTMKRYMPLTSVASDWRESSPIVWKAELEGKVARVSAAIPPENHRVTIELSGEGPQTHLSVTEHGNATERELAHSEGGWRLALANLKALLEGSVV